MIGQQTTPPELPIFGDPEKEISLELVFQKIEPVFSLSGKTLQLLKPLDRDKDNLSHIIFQVCLSFFHNLSIVWSDCAVGILNRMFYPLVWLQISCTVISSRRNRNIPIIVRVSGELKINIFCLLLIKNFLSSRHHQTWMITSQYL